FCSLGFGGNVAHIRTLQVHFKFVTALFDAGGSRLISRSGVLQCDKVSWFCHIEAPTVRFVVPALIVSGDDGLSVAAIVDEISVRRLQSSPWRSGNFRTHVGGSQKERIGLGSAAVGGARARRLLDVDRGFAVGRHAGRRAGASKGSRRLSAGS